MKKNRSAVKARAARLRRANFYRFKTGEIVKLCDESDFNMAVQCCISAEEWRESEEQARWIRAVQLHVVRSFFGKRRARTLEKELKGISVSRRELTGPSNPAKLCNALLRLEAKKTAVKVT